MLYQALQQHKYCDAKIIATDIDSNVLEKAQQGIYRLEHTQNLTPELLKRWFLRGKGEKQGLIKVSSELQPLIKFSHLNLMGKWPMEKPIDVIFCRNVVIYFDKTTQRKLFSAFCRGTYTARISLYGTFREFASRQRSI